MKILLIRHARAEERVGLLDFGHRDEDRRLTDSGRKDMGKAVRGLRKIAPDLDVLATSPLVRACQTAEIVAKVFSGPNVQEEADLSPGGAAKALLGWLRKQEVEACVALVGHEPGLSEFAGYLLTGETRSLIEFKKGAVCLLESDGVPTAGKCRLTWALAPGQLRKLAG
jgi:phosphohistidine phosphatase